MQKILIQNIMLNELASYWKWYFLLVQYKEKIKFTVATIAIIWSSKSTKSMSKCGSICQKIRLKIGKAYKAVLAVIYEVKKTGMVWRGVWLRISTRLIFLVDVHLHTIEPYYFRFRFKNWAKISWQNHILHLNN